MIQGKINILIVDSSIYHADALAQTLDQWGYQSFRSYNCGQARIIFEHCRIDLAIIGDLLPEEDGTCILEIKNKVNIPLIRIQSYMNAHSMKSIQGIENRTMALSKPVDAVELLDSISTFTFEAEAGTRLQA